MLNDKLHQNMCMTWSISPDLHLGEYIILHDWSLRTGPSVELYLATRSVFDHPQDFKGGLEIILGGRGNGQRRLEVVS